MAANVSLDVPTPNAVRTTLLNLRDSSDESEDETVSEEVATASELAGDDMKFTVHEEKKAKVGAKGGKFDAETQQRLQAFGSIDEAQNCVFKPQIDKRARSSEGAVKKKLEEDKRRRHSRKQADVEQKYIDRFVKGGKGGLEASKELSKVQQILGELRCPVGDPKVVARPAYKAYMEFRTNTAQEVRLEVEDVDKVIEQMLSHEVLRAKVLADERLQKVPSLEALDVVVKETFIRQMMEEMGPLVSASWIEAELGVILAKRGVAEEKRKAKGRNQMHSAAFLDAVQRDLSKRTGAEAALADVSSLKYGPAGRRMPLSSDHTKAIHKAVDEQYSGFLYIGDIGPETEFNSWKEKLALEVGLIPAADAYKQMYGIFPPSIYSSANAKEPTGSATPSSSRAGATSSSSSAPNIREAQKKDMETQYTTQAKVAVGVVHEVIREFMASRQIRSRFADMFPDALSLDKIDEKGLQEFTTHMALETGASDLAVMKVVNECLQSRRVAKENAARKAKAASSVERMSMDIMKRDKSGVFKKKKSKTEEETEAIIRRHFDKAYPKALTFDAVGKEALDAFAREMYSEAGYDKPRVLQVLKEVLDERGQIKEKKEAVKAEQAKLDNFMSRLSKDMFNRYGDQGLSLLKPKSKSEKDTQDTIINRFTSEFGSSVVDTSTLPTKSYESFKGMLAGELQLKSTEVERVIVLFLTPFRIKADFDERFPSGTDLSPSDMEGFKSDMMAKLDDGIPGAPADFVDQVIATHCKGRGQQSDRSVKQQKREDEQRKVSGFMKKLEAEKQKDMILARFRAMFPGVRLVSHADHAEYQAWKADVAKDLGLTTTADDLNIIHTIVVTNLKAAVAREDVGDVRSPPLLHPAQDYFVAQFHKWFPEAGEVDKLVGDKTFDEFIGWGRDELGLSETLALQILRIESARLSNKGAKKMTKEQVDAFSRRLEDEDRKRKQRLQDLERKDPITHDPDLTFKPDRTKEPYQQKVARNYEERVARNRDLLEKRKEYAFQLQKHSSAQSAQAAPSSRRAESERGSVDDMLNPRSRAKEYAESIRKKGTAAPSRSTLVVDSPPASPGTIKRRASVSGMPSILLQAPQSPTPSSPSSRSGSPLKGSSNSPKSPPQLPPSASPSDPSSSPARPLPSPTRLDAEDMDSDLEREVRRKFERPSRLSKSKDADVFGVDDGVGGEQAGAGAGAG
eukprot:CAMPEP_0184669264 /NCGR_PEP_ID=MMETSP0308-20130426/76435_1 /TAXON_ID=38269 /ORGANISM="Gloeochaete witrockiana, Strain SAG 46.84" /LENGTH=1194 /DNA_ID=CAMNT_0027115433 /DNA_START=1 /DNA_END=3581 /DNA_ORIENTATION=+